jgi:hypothetical protein
MYMSIGFFWVVTQRIVTSNTEKRISQDIYIHSYNKMSGVLRRYFGKQMTNETKFRLHGVTDKAARKFNSEVWVLKTGDEQKLEATQMKFLRQLLGITKSDRERKKSVRKKSGVQNTFREIQQYQQKWL